MEYYQSMKTTIYCSFDFKHFPFDVHKCDLVFGDAMISAKNSLLNSTIISYQGQDLNYGEGLLYLNQSRLPFDISLESLKPFVHTRAGYNFSYSGMRIHLARKNFALQIGSYYGPTLVFAMLSLVSYSIPADIVCRKD